MENEYTEYQMNMFYLINKIVNILKKQKIKTTIDTDGRLGSAKDEEIILNAIRAIINSSQYFKDVKLVEPDIRNWFDFALKSNKCFFPYNIKSSNLEAADNLSCKLGLFYTLTGVNPDNIKNITSWDIYNKELANNLNKLKSEVDYGFLIINKKDTSDIFYTILRSIETLIVNGNNLPYQCNWNKNRVLCPKNPKIKELSSLIEIYYNALSKSITAFKGFDDYVLPKYLEIMEEYRI